MSLHPWINFNGNAEEAFHFYKSILGGEFTKVVRFKDIVQPDTEHPINEKKSNKLMLITLHIENGSTLSANDVPEIMEQVNEHENRSKICIIANSKEQADTWFNGLSHGGQVEVPMCDGPWGSYFGMFRDMYGIEWIIEYYSK